MYNCNTCKYARFNYNKKTWKLQYVFCEKIKDKLSKNGYRRLRFCNYYEKLGG